MAILTHIDFEVDNFGELPAGPQTQSTPEWATLSADAWAWLTVNQWSELPTG